MPAVGIVASSVVSALWDPTMLPNMKLWLDASNPASLSTTSPVATWSDLSGQNNHYTAAGALQPTIEPTGLNGKPCVRFDGTQMMTRTAFVTSITNWLVAGVVRTDSGQPTSIRLWFSFGNNNHCGVSQQSETTAWYGWVRGGIGWTNAVAAKLDFWDVQVLQKDGVNIFVRSKGVQQGGNPAQTHSAASGATTFGGDGFGTKTKCRIAEIVAVDGTWTTTDRDKLESYLRTKWGI